MKEPDLKTDPGGYQRIQIPVEYKDNDYVKDILMELAIGGGLLVNPVALRVYFCTKFMIEIIKEEENIVF